MAATKINSERIEQFWNELLEANGGDIVTATTSAKDFLRTNRLKKIHSKINTLTLDNLKTQLAQYILLDRQNYEKFQKHLAMERRASAVISAIGNY